LPKENILPKKDMGEERRKMCRKRHEWWRSRRGVKRWRRKLIEKDE
jgi:hypothetical protein